MLSSSHFDAEAYRQAGNCPWTFFAFPTSLADKDGLPPDEDAKWLLSELRRRGLQVGIWVNGISENTSYFACPKEEKQHVFDELKRIE